MGSMLTQRECVEFWIEKTFSSSPCDVMIIAKDRLGSADKDKALVLVVMVILQECMRVL